LTLDGLDGGGGFLLVVLLVAMLTFVAAAFFSDAVIACSIASLSISPVDGCRGNFGLDAAVVKFVEVRAAVDAAASA
jgi:hypothetical protein